jgi:ribosomal protein S18 acetylase RimI-like enzyme
LAIALREPTVSVFRFEDQSRHRLHFVTRTTWSKARSYGGGVEMTHPDKGTEMFLYELSVAESHRNRGIGSALLAALANHASPTTNRADDKADMAAGGIRSPPSRGIV